MIQCHYPLSGRNNRAPSFQFPLWSDNFPALIIWEKQFLYCLEHITEIYHSKLLVIIHNIFYMFDCLKLITIISDQLNVGRDPLPSLCIYYTRVMMGTPVISCKLVKTQQNSWSCNIGEVHEIVDKNGFIIFSSNLPWRKISFWRIARRKIKGNVSESFFHNLRLTKRRWIRDYEQYITHKNKI